MRFYDWNTIERKEITESYARKLARGENLTLARVEVMRGAVTLPHHHDSEEVILVLKGAWQFHLPDGDVTVRENQLLSIPPGVEHASEALEDTLALDINLAIRSDWIDGGDHHLHHDPDDYLWAV